MPNDPSKSTNPSPSWWLRAAKWGLLIAVGVTTVGYLTSGLGRQPVAYSLPRVETATTSARSAEPLPRESSDVAKVVADLNAEFERHWEDQSVTPADPADWLAICRRLSLALVGSGMSLEEIRQLESIPESERVVAYREQLLQDKRFADYWAERFARAFVGAEEGPFLVYRRRRFVTWLSEQIAANRPYDELVRQLIVARGYFTDKPEVNFVTVTMDSGEEGQPDPIRLAGRTTRAFLGMRIDCLQCHDDFLGNVELGTASDQRGGTQQDFHQLAAFYGEKRFNPLQGIRAEDHPYETTYLSDEEATTVTPQVPFYPDLLPSEGTNAERLAAWVTHPRNRQTARAISNRVWALMFGQPLHGPVDDIPLYGALPPGLDRLADATFEFDWDLRQLIRVITDSRVFQLSSRADFEVTEAHEDSWAVYPLIRLRPEQFARSLIQASRLSTIDDSAAFALQLLAFGSENDFVKRYGDTGEDEFDQENITITQRLLVMNGELLKERTNQNPILNASSHINMFASDADTAIDCVYLAVLNRYATPEAHAYYSERFNEAESRQQAIEDLFWVLLNSSEMAWNH